MTDDRGLPTPAVSDNSAAADLSLAELVRCYIDLDDALSRSRGAESEDAFERITALETRLDMVDLGHLWRSELHSLADVIAILTLLHHIGWDCGCHPEDAQAPRQAVATVIGFLEALPPPEP